MSSVSTSGDSIRGGTTVRIIATCSSFSDSNGSAVTALAISGSSSSVTFTPGSLRLRPGERTLAGARLGDPEHVVAQTLEAQVSYLRQRGERDLLPGCLRPFQQAGKAVAPGLRRRCTRTVVALRAMPARPPDTGL